jgi:hypothetical protein
MRLGRGLKIMGNPKGQVRKVATGQKVMGTSCQELEGHSYLSNSKLHYMLHIFCKDQSSEVTMI